MRKHKVPLDSGHLSIPLGAAEGRKLEGITVYQTQEMLSLDLRFEAGFALELSFESRFKASARLLQFLDGNADLLAELTPKRVSIR